MLAVLLCLGLPAGAVAKKVAPPVPPSIEAAAPEPVITGVVVANSGGKTTPWFHQWQEFRRNVDRKSNGSLLLDYLIFGELGSGSNMAQAVISGKADIAGVGCQGIVGALPELAVPQMPFLFDSDEEADYVFDHYLTSLYTGIMAEHGLVFLQWIDFGWNDLYAREPVLTPDALAGRSVRTAPNIVGPAYLRAVKAHPEELSLSEIASPAQSDKIFAGIGTLPFYWERIPAAYKYYTKTHQAFACGVVVANKAWFDGLPAPDQDIIRTSFMPAEAARAETRAMTEQVYAELAVRGNTVIDLPPEQHNAWAAAGLPLYPDIVRQSGNRGDDIYQAILAGKQDFLQKTGQP